MWNLFSFLDELVQTKDGKKRMTPFPNKKIGKHIFKISVRSVLLVV